MKKAEEKAKELYPDWKMTGVSTVDGQDESMVRIQRVSYIQGYKQAEKDLELTWEDIQLIVSIDWDLDHEGFSCDKSTEEYYKEVLKQFKEERKK